MSADGSRPPEEEGKGRERWVDEQVARALGLTSRQCDVLCGVAQGWTNEQIAAHLGVAFATVKGHVARTLRQIGATDRAHAVAIAYEQELLRTRAVRERLARAAGSPLVAA